MKASDALAVLGLTGKPDQNEVRRAYLRGVKVCSPERDPEGFRRLREAFDFLKQNPWLLVAGEPSSRDEPEAFAVLEPAPATKVSSAPEHEFQVEADLLSEADPVVAAREMMRLYQRPAFEPGPLPAPFSCLQTFMRLVEREETELALELLNELEASATRRGRDVGVGQEVAAYWRLACEVAALVELDRKLASAVAAGLQSGDFSPVARAVGWREGSLQNQLPVQAPHVWSLIEPLVPPAPTPKDHRKREWPWGLLSPLGMFLFLALGWVFMREPASDFEPTNRSAARAAEQRWGLLDIELERRDCAAVARRWPTYRALSQGNVSKVTATERTQRILQTCPALAQVLKTDTP